MDQQADAQFRSLLAEFPKSDSRNVYTAHLALLAAMRGDSATALHLIGALPLDREHLQERSELLESPDSCAARSQG